MNNVKTSLPPSCAKAKVTPPHPIIFSAAVVLQPRNDCCFSLHYLCTRLTGRRVERRWMESGRAGNRGDALVALFVVSAGEAGHRQVSDTVGPNLKAPLWCPLNQRWRSLMVHHGHVTLSDSSTSTTSRVLVTVLKPNSRPRVKIRTS